MARGSTAPPRALDATIEEHRVWYDVERETAQRGDQRITTFVRVWLWGIIPKRAGVLPGAPGCRDAVAAHEAAAAAAIAHAPIEPVPEVEPFHWALYASRQVADADEVRLGVVVRPPPGASGAEEAARERALAVLRAALERVGVSEGAWRPPAASA